MSWAAVAGRRRASPSRVMEVLQNHGLVGRGKPPVAEDITWGSRLGAALADLGGGFALFGAFLAQRPDVVGLPHALTLEDMDLESRFGHSEKPTEGDRRRLAEALPPFAADKLDDVVPLHQDPTTVRFLSGLQQSRAMPGSHAWVLCLRREGVEESLGSDLDQLDALMPAFNDLASSPMGRRGVQAAMDGFRQWTQQRLDQRQRAEALAAFANDLVDGDLLQIPTYDPALCSEVLAVRQWLDEVPMSKTAAPSAAGLKEIGRQLHLAVLEQILVAGHAPVCADWRIGRNGRLVLVDGHFSRLSSASLPRLWAYMQHLAGHRPEEAFEAIEGELLPVAPGADSHQLRLRLRQLVPFRDGGWSERRDTLAELLALHWCVVGELGFAPSPALSTLWQSLYHVASVSRRIGLEGDPLRAALDDLRWLATFRRFRHFGDPQEMGQALETHMASLLDMPQKVDRLLQMWSGEGGEDLQLRLRVATDKTTEKRRNALYFTLCFAALMISLAFVGGRLPALGFDPAWVERASAILFLVFGIWLLKTLTRRER